MKHRTFKISSGCYRYRGYIIKNNGTNWIIGDGNQIVFTTVSITNKKSTAKQKIDSWLDIFANKKQGILTFSIAKCK